MKRIFSLILVLGSVLVLSSCNIINDCGPTGYTGETDIDDATILEIMEELQENHFLQPTEEELYQGLIEALVGSLDDPHTTYFDFDEYSQYQETFGESYVGIGVTISYVDGLIVVEEVRKDGPADQAGVLPNDIIAFVDFEDIRGENFYETRNKIIGEIGTVVTVGVLRTGFDEPIHLEITRDTIINKTVEYQVIEHNGKTIGYIEVSTFGDETADLFEEAIELLEKEDIEGLIVDLRNNGGGHLGTVLSMLREFLVDDGLPMFSTEYYINGEHHIDNYGGTRSSQRDYDIVTLINGNSASASEVFASGMQEHGEYTLIGEVSYGKGTMQTDKILYTTCEETDDGKLDCSEADRLHISIGRWLTADGNWVHFDGGTDGITPDIIVEPTVYEKAYKLFLFDGETLEYDTVDDRTLNVQYVLNIMGYDVREDGYFDMETKMAIEAIQSNNSLPVTGIVDDATLEFINNALSEFRDDISNDTQVNAALDYLTK